MVTYSQYMTIVLMECSVLDMPANCMQTGLKRCMWTYCHFCYGSMWDFSQYQPPQTPPASSLTTKKDVRDYLNLLHGSTTSINPTACEWKPPVSCGKDCCRKRKGCNWA